jgi:tripartite-type tricarboxylate transporter receptor subunit TctC
MECRARKKLIGGQAVSFRTIVLAVMLAVAALAAPPAFAQSWPSRSITLVVPFAAGGGTDAIGRVIAEKLSARLGQPVVVENKAGAASAIGTTYAAKASPDGYTLLMTTNSAMVILPLTQPAGALTYERADFSMIGLTGILPNLLIVSPKVPANNVSELIAYAKERPGQLTFASSGNGTITHLIGELFKARTGIDVLHVPYRTGVQSAPDIMEGRVQYIFDNIIWSLPMVRQGKLKGLAITSKARSSLAPDIPTVAESGVPGFEGITWLGLAAPAKTPESVIKRLDTELRAILAEPDVIAKLAATGAEPPSAPGPAGMNALLDEDLASWKGILGDGKIKLQ